MQQNKAVFVWVSEVGFRLRKDDPATLRQLLIDVHSKSNSVDATTFSDPYVYWLRAWRRVSVVMTSVFNWRTFPDLRLIYG